MVAMIARRRRNLRPLALAAIDAANPLAQGLVLAVAPGLTRGYDAAAGRLGTVVGTKPAPLLGGLAAGFGATWGIASTDRITTPLAGAFPATGRTYYFRARRNGTGGGNFGRLFDKTNGGTGQMLYWYDTNVVLNYSTYIGSVETLFGIPGTGATAAVGATFDVIVTHLQVGNTATVNAYVNGVQVLTNATGGSGSFNDSTTALTIGNRASDGIRGWDGLIEHAFVWDRVLSAPEALAAMAYPAQLERPSYSLLGVAAAAPAGLLGTNGAQENSGTSGAITQTQNLAASNGTQANTGSSAAVLMSLAGSAGSQANTGTGGAITQTLNLQGSNGTQANEGTSADVTSNVDKRYARPAADLATSGGSWTPSSGTSLAAMLSEPSADASTFIQATTPGLCEVLTNPVIDPGTNEGHVMRYQAWSDTGDGIIVRLMQGEVEIAAWVHTTLPAAPTVFAQRLSIAQAAAITNYSDLRHQFEAL